jgi:hypothetical protein
VKFAAYRDYDAARVDASNAMMALLAGAQLAAHLLRLSEGSSRLLPEVYPRVPHIGRFNLTSDKAREILDAADAHLGAMSVPYALAIHEDFLKTCLSLLHRGHLCSVGTVNNTKLAGQHAAISTATGSAFGSGAVGQLNVLRTMRNCTIHAGGRASPALVAAIGSLTPAAEVAWVRLAKRSPRGIRVGDRVTFHQGELILALAVTKTLGREANIMLQSALPRTLWAELVVEDLLTTHPTARRAPDGLRAARGLARFHYGPLALTDAELTAAL